MTNPTDPTGHVERMLLMYLAAFKSGAATAYAETYSADEAVARSTTLVDKMAGDVDTMHRIFHEVFDILVGTREEGVRASLIGVPRVPPIHPN